jgi:CBS domain-containing protein
MSTASTPHYIGSFTTPSIEHATVADAMHPGVLTCSQDATVTEIARIMAGHHIHSVVVMGIAHESAGEKLMWRLITDVDVLEAGLPGGAEPTAETLARHPVTVVETTTPLHEAARLMIGSHLTHVLVVDSENQHPVGVLSTLDVLGTLGWGEA